MHLFRGVGDRLWPILFSKQCHEVADEVSRAIGPSRVAAVSIRGVVLIKIVKPVCDLGDLNGDASEAFGGHRVARHVVMGTCIEGETAGRRSAKGNKRCES